MQHHVTLVMRCRRSVVIVVGVLRKHLVEELGLIIVDEALGGHLADLMDVF